jgi:type VI secretion system secreted protein Hcp
MAIDIFLKIDGVDGESTDDKHKNEIALLSFSWGEAQLTPAGGGGAGAGKVAMQDFHFTTLVNKASPRLFLACAKGEHFKTAVLTVRRAGGSPMDFLTWRLTDVLVSGYQTAGQLAGGALPADHVSLGFEKVKLEYIPVKPDGKPDVSVKAGWDVKANRPV